MERCASTCSKRKTGTARWNSGPIFQNDHPGAWNISDWLIAVDKDLWKYPKCTGDSSFPFSIFPWEVPHFHKGRFRETILEGLRFFLTKSSASNVAETRVEFGLTNPVICLDLPKVVGKSSEHLLPSGGERWWWFTMVEIPKISPQKKKSMKYQILIGWVVVWLLKGSLMTKGKWTNLSEVAGQTNSLSKKRNETYVSCIFHETNSSHLSGSHPKRKRN